MYGYYVDIWISRNSIWPINTHLQMTRIALGDRQCEAAMAKKFKCSVQSQQVVKKYVTVRSPTSWNILEYSGRLMSFGWQFPCSFSLFILDRTWVLLCVVVADHPLSTSWLQSWKRSEHSQIWGHPTWLLRTYWDKIWQNYKNYRMINCTTFRPVQAFQTQSDLKPRSSSSVSQAGLFASKCSTAQNFQLLATKNCSKKTPAMRLSFFAMAWWNCCTILASPFGSQLQAMRISIQTF